MHGAVFGSILVIVGITALALGGPALVVLPVMLVLLLAIFVVPLIMGGLNSVGNGTPSSGEASYDATADADARAS